MKVQGTHTNLLDILDVVQLQNVSDIKTAVRTATADISVEGGSSSRFHILRQNSTDCKIIFLSRLRITVVKEKNEEKSVSETMTLKVTFNKV